MLKVFIDGNQGTTGLRLAERLSQRAGIELLALPDERRKDPEARRQMMKESDVAFFCLPDVAARESNALAEGLSCRIIDTSTAHRVGTDFIYGMPELSAERRTAIERGCKIAVPGCHATGLILLLAPLQRAGLIDPSYQFSMTSLTGYSGGGKTMIADYEGDARKPGDGLSAPRLYAHSQQHKHLPEMQAYAGLTYAPYFFPIVAPYYAGMLVTVPLPKASLRRSVTADDLTSIYQEHFQDSHFVTVHASASDVDPDGMLTANAMAGRDDLEMWVLGGPERLVLCARYDNLGKGASGAAIQCMNIMLGLPEAEGLVISSEKGSE